MGRKDELDEEMELQDSPAMSHAQKRKLKKRKRGDDADDASDGEPDSSTTKKNKTESNPKDDGETKGKNVPARLHSVWVGNMAFKTTPEDLRTFFKDVEAEITRVKMPRKEGGEKGPNKG